MSSEHKKIDILIPDFGDLGAQRVAINLANLLYTKNAGDISFVVFHKEGPFQKYLNPEIKIIDIGKKVLNIPKLRVIFLLLAYAVSAKKRRVSLAISFSPITNYAGLLAKLFRGPKVIIQEHAFPSLFFKDKENLSPLYGFAFRHFLFRLYNNADKFVTITEAIKDDYVRNFRIRPELFRIIRNPVDTKKIRSMAEEDVPEFVFDKKKKYLIGVGRLSEQKNFSRLITAFAIVKQNLPEAELVILGRGPLEQELKTQARAIGLSNEIHFLGFQSNPYKFISRSDVFCLSSTWEGLPQVLAEAMICCVPIVANDCQSGPREMIKNGETGFLTEYGNTEEFAERITFILNNPILSKTLASSAHAFASKKYSTEKYVADYEDLISELVKKETSKK